MGYNDDVHERNKAEEEYETMVVTRLALVAAPIYVQLLDREPPCAPSEVAMVRAGCATRAVQHARGIVQAAIDEVFG
jgi:hypothetical protein